MGAKFGFAVGPALPSECKVTQENVVNNLPNPVP